MDSLVRLAAALWAGPLLWLWGRGISCYYPFLLSARWYFIIRRPLLRSLLISDGLNRSASTRTRLADRDKLPVLGAVNYGLGAVLLAGFYLAAVCGVLVEWSGNTPPTLASLASLTPWLLTAAVLLGALAWLLYLIDYGVGKLFDPNGGRL